MNLFMQYFITFPHHSFTNIEFALLYSFAKCHADS